jgi:hypothetical protein
LVQAGSGAVCAKTLSLSFRSQFHRRGICLPLAAKQQIPRATIPRFGLTILRDFSNCTTTFGLSDYAGKRIAFKLMSSPAGQRLLKLASFAT